MSGGSSPLVPVRKDPLAHSGMKGGESALLPSMLLSGVLCLLTHVHIEWHLPILATGSEDLVGTTGLRLAFEHLLHHGCAASTQPGLHAGPGGKVSSSPRGEAPSMAAPRVMVDHEESTGSAAAFKLARRAAYAAFGEPRMVDP